MIDVSKSALPGLGQGLAARRAALALAVPFPQSQLDGVVAEEVLTEVLLEFPDVEADWRLVETPGKSHRKQITRSAEHLGPVTRYLVGHLQSSAFLSFLEELTGIPRLIPDPHLTSGGLHQIAPGGFLGLHTDYFWEERLRLYRRINLILYLNRGWKEEYAGHLELWDDTLTSCTRILPVWNRMLILPIGPTTHHGFPTPIACPAGTTRKSLEVEPRLRVASSGRRSIPGDRRCRLRRSTRRRSRVTGRLDRSLQPPRFDTHRVRTGCRAAGTAAVGRRPNRCAPASTSAEVARSWGA